MESHALDSALSGQDHQEAEEEEEEMEEEEDATVSVFTCCFGLLCLFSHSCVGKVLTGFWFLKFHWSRCNASSVSHRTNVFHPEFFHGQNDGKDSLSLSQPIVFHPDLFHGQSDVTRQSLTGTKVFHQDVFHGQSMIQSDSLSQGPGSFTQTCSMVRMMVRTVFHRDQCLSPRLVSWSE